MAKITGIGGVFFKAKTDDKALREWYQKHLGLELAEWGGAALRGPEDRAEDKGVTAWHVAEPTTKWFSPSQSSFMINSNRQYGRNDRATKRRRSFDPSRTRVSRERRVPLDH